MGNSHAGALMVATGFQMKGNVMNVLESATSWAVVEGSARGLVVPGMEALASDRYKCHRGFITTSMQTFMNRQYT